MFPALNVIFRGLVIVQDVSVYLEMMKIDNKILLFFSISVVLLSLYYIWSVLFIYIIILLGIYYDFNPNTNSIQGHGFTKVKNIIVKVRIFILHTIPSLYSIYNNIDYTVPNNNTTKMFTQSGWDNKRVVNRSASVLTPIPCIGSNSLANIGKHTSTPISPIIYRGADLTSNSSMVRPNRIKQPERYSLSDTSYNTSQLNSSMSPAKDHQNSPKSIPNAAGPLLASSRYNIGMGTYTDMHSPGFASRIVQYSGEYGESEHGRERERLTHLAKYGSPGLFPVVNLNKTPLKSVKVAGHRPVTVRIAPPDNSYNMDRSLILNQSLQSPNQQVNNTTATQSEISTRSVLDALKEISRKRIHARDDSIEKNKRQRKNSLSSGHGHTESIDTPLSSKRVRDIDINNEQSFNGSNGSSPSPKKYKQVKHGYNDIISSLSSSIHLRQQYANKRKSEMTVPKDTDINKQIKLNARSSPIKPPETIYNSAQNTVTIVENTSPSVNKHTKSVITKENNTESTKEKSLNNNNNDNEINKKQVENFNEGTIVNENGVCRLTFISNPPEKQNDIFVPFKPPTEESKRKRLAALLGALSGEDWDVKTLTKKFFPPDNEEDAVDSSKSHGILVSPGATKPSDAVKKHVTFNIPSSTILTSSTESPVTNKPEITTTSVSITQPISSTMSFGTGNNLPTSESQSINPSATTGNNIENTSKNNETSVETIAIKFGTPEVSKSVTATPTTSAMPVISFGSNNITPVINFESKSTETKQATLNFGTTQASDPKPSGGFSFDLHKKSETTTSTNISTTTTPSLSFASTTKDTNKLEENKSTFASPFGTAAFSPKSTSVPITTIPTNPTFSFGNVANKDDKVQSRTLSFNSQNSAFSTPKTTSNITSPFGSSNIPSFGTPTTSTTSAFGASTTSSTPAFATPTTNTSTFGTTSTNNLPTFGAQTTSNAPTFGTSTVNNAPTFGTPATTNNTPTFGTPTTNNSTSFGSSFGIPATTSASVSFGNSTPAVPSFGSVTTTTSNAPLFGSTTTASNTFSFGSSNTSSAFGKPNTNNQGFGQINTTSTFGVQNTTANTPSFGSNVTPAFGSTSSGFGAPTTTTSSGFGSTPFGSSSNVSSPFGGNNNTPQFGTPTTTANTFGTTNTGFGTPTTTAQFGSTTSAVSSPFGSNASSTTPAFGVQTTQSSGFGTQSTPIFGSSTTQQPTFGSNSTSTGNTTNIFGSNNSTPTAFGSTNNASTFGNNSATNKPFGATTAFNFGASTTTQNNNTFGGTSGGFGSTTSTFGASSPPAFGAQNNNVFGSTTQSTNSTTTNTAVPLFGTTNQTPAFGTPDNKQPPAFGGFGSNSQVSSPSSVFAFGGGTQSASNSTNNSNAFQFGASKPPSSGGFNFSANTSTPPAFGNSVGNATPAFGGNQFGAPVGGAPNMFSIGTGSTAPRPRATARYNRKK